MKKIIVLLSFALFILGGCSGLISKEAQYQDCLKACGGTKTCAIWEDINDLSKGCKQFNEIKYPEECKNICIQKYK